MSNTEGNSSSPGLPAVLDDALDALARPPRSSGLFGRGQADAERWELLAGTLRTVREQVTRAADDARAASQKAEVAEARLGSVTREFDKARQQSSQLFATVRHKLDALQAELDQSRAALTERLRQAEDAASAGDRALAASIEAGNQALADARAALAASIEDTNSSLATLARTREAAEAQLRAENSAAHSTLSAKLDTGLTDLASQQQKVASRLETAIGTVKDDLTSRLNAGIEDLSTRQKTAENRLETAIGTVKEDLTNRLKAGIDDLSTRQQTAETRLETAISAVKDDLTNRLNTGIDDLSTRQQTAETRLETAIGTVKDDLTTRLNAGISDLTTRQQTAETRLDAAVAATRSELDASIQALGTARAAAESALRDELTGALAEAEAQLGQGLDGLRAALASEAETSARRSDAAAQDLVQVRSALTGFQQSMQEALGAEAANRTELATSLEAAIASSGAALGERIDGLARDRDTARAAFEAAIADLTAQLSGHANDLAAGKAALAAAEQALGARLEGLANEQARATQAAADAVVAARRALEERIAAADGLQSAAVEALRKDAQQRFEAAEGAIAGVQAALDGGLKAAESALATRASALASALEAGRSEDAAAREDLQQRIAHSARELRDLLTTLEAAQARTETAFADLSKGLDDKVAGVGARIDRMLAAGQSAVADAATARGALADQLAALQKRQAQLNETLEAEQGTQTHLAEDLGTVHADIEKLQAAIAEADAAANGRRAELETSLSDVRAEFEAKLAAISSQLAAIPAPATMLQQARASEVRRLRHLEDGLLALGARLGGRVLEAAGGPAAFDGRLAETLRAILGTAVERRILMLGDPGEAGRLLIGLLQGMGHHVTLVVTDDYAAPQPGGGAADAFANIWADNGAGATPDWMLVGPLLHAILAAQLQADPDAPVARRARTMLEYARFKITAARDPGAVSRPWTSADFGAAARQLGLSASQRRRLRPYLLADLLLARFRRLWAQLTGDAAVAGSMSTPLQPGLVEAVKGLDPVFDRAVARLRRRGLADAVGFEGAALARIDKPDPAGGTFDGAAVKDRLAAQNWCSPFWRGLFARYDLVAGFGGQGTVPWLAGHEPLMVTATSANLAADPVLAAAVADAQLTLIVEGAPVARPLDVAAPLAARSVPGLPDGAPVAAVAGPVVATVPPEELQQLAQRLAGVENRASVVDLHASDLDWLKNRMIEVGNALNLVEVQTGNLVATSIKADSGVDFLNTRVGELSMDLFHVRNALGLKLTESITSYSVVDRLQDVILHARSAAAEVQVRSGNRAKPRQPVRTEAMPVDEIWAEFARRAPHNIDTFREAFDVGAASYVGFPVGSCSVSGAPLAHQFSRFVSSYIVNSAATLDVGCGPQAKPLYLEMADPDSIHGVDILAPYEPHPFPYVQTAGEFLPWEDESFDLLLSGGALDHYYLLDVGMEEAWRVLRPGGHFVGNITLFDDAPPYDPYAGPMEAYDEEHLFHINMAWFEPFMRERGFELVELMQFHLPFIYGIMAFKKVDKPARQTLKPPARGGGKKK